MICGVPALSISHPAIVPALHTREQIARRVTCLFGIRTIPSNRHRDPRQDPEGEAARVVLEKGEGVAFQPNGRVAAETPFDTAANRHDTEPAQLSSRMLRIDDDRAVLSRQAVLRNAVVLVIPAGSRGVERCYAVPVSGTACRPKAQRHSVVKYSR